MRTIIAGKDTLTPAQVLLHQCYWNRDLVVDIKLISKSKMMITTSFPGDSAQSKGDGVIWTSGRTRRNCIRWIIDLRKVSQFHSFTGGGSYEYREA